MSVYNTEKDFKVIDMKAFTKDDLITFYVDFEEKDPKYKSKFPLTKHHIREDWLCQDIWGRMSPVLELFSTKTISLVIKISKEFNLSTKKL